MNTIVQTTILEDAKKHRTNVNMFLMNGFQLRGTIAEYDESVVVLVTDGKHQMIYKHAISTITPAK